MHEVALLSCVIRLVEERLAGRPACRPVAVRIRVSPWSHLSEHDVTTLNQTFSMVATGTRAEGARLEVIRTRGPVSCPACGWRQDGQKAMDTCLSCGTTILFLTQAPGVWLQDIEVEDT